MEVVSVHATFANMKEAKAVARVLIKEKLIACANLLPCESIYLWRGQVEETAEVVAIFKTVDEKSPRLFEEIKKLSSYEEPSIFVAKVDRVSPEVLDWLVEVLG